MARLYDTAGDSSFVTLPNFNTLTAITMAGWFYPTGTSTAYRAICVWGGDAGIFLHGNVMTMAYYSGPTQGRDPAAISVSSNQWFHAASTAVSNTVGGGQGYLNGATDGAAWNTQDFSTTSDTLFRIADDSSNQVMHGRVADVAMWNVALSAFEIASLAKGIRPFMIRPKALIGYWPIDGLVSAEPDLSGNGRNTTLNGTPVFAFGPPTTQFTPRWPQVNPISVPTPPALVFSRQIVSIPLATPFAGKVTLHS